MSKALTFLIGSLIGLLVGGLLTFYLFVSAPRAGQPLGTLIQPPDANGNPPATVQIVLKQDFFNEVLKTIFRDMNAPSFPLGATEKTSEPAGNAPLQSGQCIENLTLLPEGSGMQSSIKFENGKILAPLAFRGTYNSIVGCLNFTGWAQANLELRFDAEKQTVFGQLNIETVNLDGVNPLLSSIITPLVQSTLNRRVNPLQILQANKVALNIPIAASNGNIAANVKDARAEIKENALNLYVIYELIGNKEQ